MGAWAAARQPRGGVLVIHENRGLNDSIRAIAGRLAASGYSALAIDLLSEEGGTGSFADESRRWPRSAPPAVEIRRGPEGGGDRAPPPAPGKKVAATGFCFGGGMTWLLLAWKESRLAAAAPFYGPFPEGGNLAGAKAAVLGIYAELDSQGERQPPAARAALRKAGLRHQIVTYPGVDHAFFNPTRSRMTREAAQPPIAAAELVRHLRLELSRDGRVRVSRRRAVRAARIAGA